MRPTLPHALLALALLMLVTGNAAAQQPRATAVVAGDPFAAAGWHLEMTAHGALEAWNYNISHEEMAGGFVGFTYGVREGLVFRMASPTYYVSQRGSDAVLFGITWGVRGRVLKRPRWAGFWEAEVGASEADTYTPPGGTRFNYLALAGAGVTFRLRKGIHGLAGLRWVHLSNNSLAGRHRNPDIEAIGPTLGLLYAF